MFTAVLGFVLAGDPSAQQSIRDSALKQFPSFLGSDLKGGTIHGSGLALAIGLVGTILSGLGVTLAAQTAFNRVYGVKHRDRPNFLSARLRGLAMLAVLGLLQVVSTVASGAVAGGLGGVGTLVAGQVVALGLNVLLFFAAFRFLTDTSVPRRGLWPGILTAAVLWTILQAVGGVYVNHVLKGAKGTYGSFATVIGLLTWLFVGARIVVYSAEVNTVLTRRLWPRSLLGPPTPADHETLRTLAEIEERQDEESVDVSFERPARD